jgi:hypothetical protein
MEWKFAVQASNFVDLLTALRLPIAGSLRGGTSIPNPAGNRVFIPWTHIVVHGHHLPLLWEALNLTSENKSGLPEYQISFFSLHENAQLQPEPNRNRFH